MPHVGSYLEEDKWQLCPRTQIHVRQWGNLNQTKKIHNAIIPKGIRAAYGKDKSALQAQTTVTRWWRWSVMCEVKAVITNRAITQASNNPIHNHRGTSCKEEETWPSQLLNHGPSSDRDVSGTVKRVSVQTKTFWTDLLTNCWSKQCDQLFTIRTRCKNYNGCLLNILWLFV